MNEQETTAQLMYEADTGQPWSAADAADRDHYLEAAVGGSHWPIAPLEGDE